MEFTDESFEKERERMVKGRVEKEADCKKCIPLVKGGDFEAAKVYQTPKCQKYCSLSQ